MNKDNLMHLALMSSMDFGNASRTDYSRSRSRDQSEQRAALSAAQKKRDRKNQKRLASRNGAK